ncbi:hypothetical protein Glove_103g226 [Diversispora epigaea]|uniref:Chitin-binding type-1 domain-containing protein n=1 Tax=Diversispora epigaea TaxID=1348612 RepID=A0A397J7S6_9GLOM|nr:hypothetical protein Glove_103g226 [Diversispora epigaea]
MRQQTSLTIFTILFLIVISILGENVEAQCGNGLPKCPNNLCCSQWGWCGSTSAYCGTGCQPLYGRCTGITTTTLKTTTTTPKSTTTTPKTTTTTSKTTTTNSATPKPSGRPIYSCSVPGTMAITFDDGPYLWTNDLLNNLKALNAKATFFINGNNWDCVYNYASVLKRIVAEGHQLAHHTWGHLDLATLSRDQIVFQMTNLENALLKIVGVAPRYMRLPYGSGVNNPLVMDTLTSLGYNVILWDIDTDDWRGLSTQESLNKYRAASKPPGAHIALQHDRIENTARSLGPEAVKLARSLGFKVTTVGECLGENSSSLWYKKIVTPSAPDGTWKC